MPMAAAGTKAIPPCSLLRRLHKEAQFTLWQPDILRHTFASHHLAHFRSYAVLQVEMGHRSAELLRTRYVHMPEKDNLFSEWGLEMGLRMWRRAAAG